MNTKPECCRNPPCLQDHNIMRLVADLYRKIDRWGRIKTEADIDTVEDRRRRKFGKITWISYLKKWHDQIAGYDIIDSGAVTLDVVGV